MINAYELARRTVTEARHTPVGFTKAVLRKALMATSQEAAERRYQDQLDARKLAQIKQQRSERLVNPDYQTLLLNTYFQDWRSGKDMTVPTRSMHRRWISAEMVDAYNIIAEGTKPVPFIDGMAGLGVNGLETYVDPNYPTSELKRKSRLLCQKSASRFVKAATEVAASYGTTDAVVTSLDKKDAIAYLMGTHQLDSEKTIFKDFDWHTSNYTPDFVGLGVAPKDVGVSLDKITAGIGLCIGLWVQLADAGERRPVSGASFGPPLSHCSFQSLLLDSGWAEQTNMPPIIRLAGSTSPAAEQYLQTFRRPEFFADRLAELQAS